MLIVSMPYCPREEGDPVGQDLGLALNRFFEECLGDDDWGLVMDHDMALVSPGWRARFERAISERPEAGIFIPYLSIALKPSGWQVRSNGSNVPDMGHHIDLGMKVASEINIYQDVSRMGETPGTFHLTGIQCLSKRTWKAVGGFPSGKLFVDWGMHARVVAARRTVILLTSVYVYHWLRGKRTTPG